MFAALPALTPVAAVSLAAALGAVGVLIFGGVGIYAVNKIRARRAAAAGGAPPATAKKAILPGLFGNASAALNSPLVKEAEKVVVQAIHDSHHAALNAAVAKMFPPLAPFIPLIDRVADAGLAKISGDAPAQPAAPAVVIPQGHPVLDLLQKVLEAHHQQQSTAGKAA